MHELSVCQALLEEVSRVARAEGAKAVRSVSVRVGPLSGIEAHSLERAFEVARCGTLAQEAALILETTNVRIRCTECAAEHDTAPNRLLCASCGDYRTRVIAGDELILSAIELDVGVDEELAAAADDFARDVEAAGRSDHHV